MKNLKRVLALVISLVFVMSTVAFAADDTTATTTDSTKTDETTATTTTTTETLTDAENVLTQLNIMVGTDKGFEGEKSLTRAEAARLMYSLAVQFGGEAATSLTTFNDVAATHWASGYVAGLNGTKVNGKAIINGTSATTFTPDKNVSYDEFNTMLTIALGYYPYAKEAGAYPAGYKAAAVKAKLYSGEFGDVTYGGSKEITREEVATMMANALVAKPVIKNGYGTSASYEDGTVPYVQDKYDIDVTVGTLRVSNDKYIITPIDKEDVDYVGQYIGTAKKDMVIDTKVDGLEGAVKEAVGRKATIFSYNKTIKSVGSVEERNAIASTNDVRRYQYVINSDGTGTVSVYKTKNYAVSKDVRVTVNGVDISSPSDVAKAVMNAKATSTDGKYVYGADHVSVAIYGENKTVDEIALTTWSYGTVDAKYDSSNRVKLVGESKVNNKFYTVTKANDDEENCTLIKDGKTANVSDLKEDDVIKVAVIPSEGTKDKDDDLYNLTYATKTITGKATASKRGTTTDDVTDNHLYYKIGDTYYAVNTYADTTNVDNTKSTDNFDLNVAKDLKVGVSGTFTLTGDNEIVGFDKSTSSNEEHVGYLSYVGWANGRDAKKLTFSVYFGDQEKTYTTTDELGDGEVCDAIVIQLAKAAGLDPVDAVNNDTGVAVPDGKVDVKIEKTNSHDANKVTNDKKDVCVDLINGIGDNGSLEDADPIYRYITLTFNGDNPDTADMWAEAVKAGDANGTLKYNKNTMSLTGGTDRIDMISDTKVYVQDGNALTLKDTSYLVDKNYYKGVAPIVDPEDKDQKVIGIIISGGSNTNKDKYAIATSDAILTSEYKEDGTYAQVNAIVDGAEVTLTSKGSNSGRLEDIKVGEYFKYRLNVNGLVESVSVVANKDAFVTTKRTEGDTKYADDVKVANGFNKLSSTTDGLAIVTDVQSTKLTYATDIVSKYYNPTTNIEYVGGGIPVYVYDYDTKTVSYGTASKMLSSAKSEIEVDDNNTVSAADDIALSAIYNGVYVRRATADDTDYTKGEVMEIVIYQGIPDAK